MPIANRTIICEHLSFWNTEIRPSKENGVTHWMGFRMMRLWAKSKLNARLYSSRHTDHNTPYLQVSLIANFKLPNPILTSKILSLTTIFSNLKLCVYNIYSICSEAFPNIYTSLKNLSANYKGVHDSKLDVCLYGVEKWREKMLGTSYLYTTIVLHSIS